MNTGCHFYFLLTAKNLGHKKTCLNTFILIKEIPNIFNFYHIGCNVSFNGQIIP